MNQEIPWKRFSIEAAVIVGSILLAFAIEAWWDELNDSSQAQALLSALAEDLRESQELLADAKRNHESILEASQTVLDFGELGNVDVSQRSEFEDAVGNHFLRTRYNPPLGTVESILSSGRLDLIEESELVPALNQWIAQVNTLEELQSALEEHFYERIYPYLAARVDLEDLDKGFANYVEFPWSQVETDAYTLVDDNEFLSMVYMHWVLSQNCLMFLRPVEEQLELLIGLL